MSYKKQSYIILLTVLLTVLSMSAFSLFGGNKINRLLENAASASLNPKILKLALQAHEKAKAQGLIKTSYLTVVDYSLPSKDKRLWVFDLRNNALKFHEYVAHGSGSGIGHSTKFSNRPRSHASSLGVYITGKFYQGRHGKSLRLHGQEETNSNAFSRAVVIHGAKYVNDTYAKFRGRLGRSHGCLALSYQCIHTIMNTLGEGSLVFCYYPDPNWLNNSEFINS